MYPCSEWHLYILKLSLVVQTLSFFVLLLFLVIQIRVSIIQVDVLNNPCVLKWKECLIECAVGRQIPQMGRNLEG